MDGTMSAWGTCSAGAEPLAHGLPCNQQLGPTSMDVTQALQSTPHLFPRGFQIAELCLVATRFSKDPSILPAKIDRKFPFKQMPVLPRG